MASRFYAEQVNPTIPPCALDLLATLAPMKSLLILAFLFSLLFLQFGNTGAARKDAGEYWRAIMKDRPMPEAIQGLVHIHDQGKDCHEKKPEEIELKEEAVFIYGDDDKKAIVKDFEPRPKLSAYGNDEVGASKADKSFVADFEPKPGATAYNE